MKPGELSGAQSVRDLAQSLCSLQPREEGSGQQINRFEKAINGPPPSPPSPLKPPRLICIWSPDHVLFISNHNQSGKKLINEGARQERYPPSGGRTDPPPPASHTHIHTHTHTHTQPRSNTQAGSSKQEPAVRKTHTFTRTHTHRGVCPLARHRSIFRWVMPPLRSIWRGSKVLLGACFCFIASRCC